ncbi:tyrosine-type recombinase/integrase [Ewingella americana]|uniref:tyrosine-type recombinase/integrase n=1 Tax=Ewingella americana TaxID=41202 RepID=UPI00163B499E|nr:tyrosine-type recombinase/integrase [Ewingella americana]QMV53730.1 tyrosine-type recombinase/integrase [Ewingella americana]
MIAATATGKNSSRDECMLLMCFIHGLRVTELINLRVSDIELTTKRISVSRLKNGITVQHPLQHREVAVIEQWLQIRAGFLDADTPWLFLSKHGGQLSRQQFYRLVRKYGESAGLDVQVHPHMLRHACGFALADKGLDTRLIQDYLGHKNIQNTVIYAAKNVKRLIDVDI